MAVETVTVEIGDVPIELETGKLAKQANGSVVVRSGDTVVLVTAVLQGASANLAAPPGCETRAARIPPEHEKRPGAAPAAPRLSEDMEC